MARPGFRPTRLDPATDAPTSAMPHVVIVGAGFAGPAGAAALGGTELRVTLIDRNDDRPFRPLFRRVATAALSSSETAGPIRLAVTSETRIAIGHRGCNVDVE